MSTDWTELRTKLLEKMDEQLELIQENKHSIIDDMLDMMRALEKRIEQRRDGRKEFESQLDVQEYFRLEYLNIALAETLCAIAAKTMFPDIKEY